MKRLLRVSPIVSGAPASARSQLAEGLARSVFPEAEIESAGSHPGKLNPHAVAVMKEIGLDVSNHYSKSVDDLSPKFIVGLDGGAA